VGAKAEIDMTPEELAAATALSKEAREARTRIKELETKAADAELTTKARALVAEGKHLDAVALLGIDLNAAVAEQLGGAPADGAAVDPKVAELAETVKKLEAAATERAKRDAAELQARTAEARKQDVAAIVEHVKAEAVKYPYLARNPAWVQEAYDTASDLVPKVIEQIKAREGAARELTPEEKHRLMEAALLEAEASHAEKAKLYGPSGVALERPGGAAPPRPGARPSTFDASMRGGTATPVTKPKTKLTFSEVKRARRTAN
jgi:hypothetical protein